MIEVATPARARVTVREPGWMDVRQFVRIEDQMPAPHWAHQDFRTVLRAEGIASAVAEVNGQVVAFLLYQVDPPPEHGVRDTLRDLFHWHWPWRRDNPRQIHLLHIAVAPEYQRRGIGKALLAQVHRQFKKPADRFQAIVPETNLAVQLFLREAGYRATLILPGGPESEDRYLMERPGR